MATLKSVSAVFDSNPAVSVPLTAAVVSAVTAACTPVAPAPTPAPTPAPIPATPVAPVKRIVAVPNAPDSSRAAGVNCYNPGGSQAFSDIHIEGFVDNLLLQQFKAGLNVSLQNIRSIGAYSLTELFGGQGIYASGISGQFNVLDCVFAHNGMPAGNESIIPTQYRHGCYIQNDCTSPTFDTCIFAGNANAGVQFRNPNSRAIFKNCIFFDNGTAILQVMGGAILEHCSILGAHLYFDGAAYTGGSQIINYWPMSADDLVCVEEVGQCAPPLGQKGYPQGMISSGGTWVHTNPSFTPPPAGIPLTSFSRSRVLGYGVSPMAASGSMNKAYNILTSVLSESLDVPNAVTQLHTLIRGSINWPLNPVSDAH